MAPNSSFALAKLFTIAILPVFLIGPIAGAYADIIERRKLLFLSNLLRGIMIFLLSLIMPYGDIILVYSFVFLFYSLGRFFLTARLSLLPDLVKNEQLLPANTIISTFSALITSLSVGVSGFLIPRLGLSFSMGINCLLYFLPAIFPLFLLIDISQRKIDHLKEFQFSKIISNLYDGLRYIFNEKEMRFLIRIFSLLVIVAGGSYVTLTVFIQEQFKSITEDLGIIGMCIGLGFIIGAWLLGHLGEKFKKEKTLLVSFILGGIQLLAITFLLKFLPRITLVAGLSFLLGISLAPAGILSVTILQQRLPADFRGRIFGSLEFLVHICLILAMAIIGMIADYISRFFILIMLSCFLIALSLYELYRRR